MRYLCANRPGLRADRPNRFSQPNLRADNGTRTRGLNLGKVALYQLSYVRNVTLTGNRGIHYPTACTNGTKIATRLKFRGIGHRSLLLMSSRIPHGIHEQQVAHTERHGVGPRALVDAPTHHRHRVRARRIRLPSGVTCCAGAKSPVHSSPSHQRISEGSPDGSGYQPGGMFMIAPVRIGPLRSGSCRSPASRPRLAYSARHLHRPRITAPRHRRRDTGKPAPIVQPPATRDAHNATSSRRCSVSLPDPSITPECRLSRGFCTALRVFKRV